jgi:hypothetical protein
LCSIDFPPVVVAPLFYFSVGHPSLTKFKMSSRVIKAKLAPKVTIPQSHEENDNEPERTQNYDNPFELVL